MTRFFFNSALFIAILYLAICAVVYFFQEKMLFFPAGISSPPTLLQKFKPFEISFEHNGVQLNGWLLNPDQEKIIIYFGGNADEVSVHLPDFHKLSEYTVLLVNYRGYGKSSGKPGEAQLFADAKFLYDQLMLKQGHSIEKIILFGRSLGSGVATYLAAQRPVDGLILITPYNSIKYLAGQAYPFLPVGLLLKHPFESEKYGKNPGIPSLVLIAQKDEVISFSSSQKLVEALGDDCISHIVNGAGHNDIQEFPVYWQLIQKFLAQI